MAKVKLIIIIILFLSTAFYGQDKCSWIEEFDEKFSSNIFFSTQIKRNYKIKKNKTKNNKALDLLKEGMKKDLKNQIASNISSEIKTTVKSSVLETISNNKNNFKSSFSIESTITSELKILNPEFDFCYVKEDELLYAYIAIRKQKLIDYYENKLNIDIKKLIITSSVSSSKSDPSLYLNKKYKKIKSDKKLIESNLEFYIIIGGKNIYSINNLLNEVEINIQSLGDLLSTKEIDENIIKAEKLLNSANYKLAKSIFNDVRTKRPDEERVIRGIEKCDNELEKYYFIKFNEAKNQKKYNEAINAINELIEVNENTYATYEKYLAELKEEYFYHNLKSCKERLNYSDYPEAKRLLDEISIYSSVNPKKYDAVMQSILLQRKKDDTEFINKFLYNKNYYEALKQILLIQRKYDFDKGLVRKEDQITKKIYRYNKKEFKKLTTNTYHIKLGVNSVTSVSRDIVDVIDNLNSYTNYTNIAPYYYVDLYRRVNIKKRWLNKKDKSKSSLVGLQFGVLDNNYSKTFYNSDSLSHSFNSNVFLEPQISTVFWRIFNFKAGVVIGDNNLLSTNMKIDYYSTTFGLKFRFWNICTDFNVKAISNFENENYLFAEIGISYGFNIFKKINKKDKNNLKREIELKKSEYRKMY